MTATSSVKETAERWTPIPGKQYTASEVYDMIFRTLAVRWGGPYEPYGIDAAEQGMEWALLLKKTDIIEWVTYPDGSIGPMVVNR